MDDEKVLTLLGQIHEAQLRFNEDYRRHAADALAIQRQSFELQAAAVAQQTTAVTAQARHLRLYRRVLAISAVVLVAAVVAIVVIVTRA